MNLFEQIREQCLARRNKGVVAKLGDMQNRLVQAGLVSETQNRYLTSTPAIAALYHELYKMAVDPEKTQEARERVRALPPAQLAAIMNLFADDLQKKTIRKNDSTE